MANPAQLNHREIDMLLEELPLSGSQVQDMIQFKFKQLFFHLYNNGTSYSLRFRFEGPITTMYSPSRTPRIKKSNQRFEQLLRSKLQGGVINRAFQWEKERYLCLEIDSKQGAFRLWFRLWANSGNCFLCDSANSIIDVLFRRPKKGEVSGEKLILPEAQKSGKVFEIRPIAPGYSLNKTIEKVLEEEIQASSTETQLEKAEELLTKEIGSTKKTLYDRTTTLAQIPGWEILEIHGQLLSSYQYKAKDGRLDLSDDESGIGQVTINFDPKLSPSAAVQKMLAKAQESKDLTETLSLRIEEQKQKLAQLELQLKELQEASSDQAALMAAEILSRGITQKQTKSGDYTVQLPGIRIKTGPFLIVVGRNAGDNDELLRRFAKGNDTWVHTRDVAGSHVFIRAPKGSTIPLDTLIDAGHLAVYYSKARKNGKADLYYTQVKYLRRVKNGPKGKVIPTQEKNLYVELDVERVRNLLAKSCSS